MTLVNRVSAFFLAALAVALAASSLMLYSVMKREFSNAFFGEIDRVLNPLVAAVEVEPGSVKWQPTEHAIDTGLDRSFDAVRWIVADDRGKIVDNSRNFKMSGAQFENELIEYVRWSQSDRSPRPLSDAALPDHWSISQRRVVAPPRAPGEEDDDPRESDEFDELIVTAARPTERLDSDLRRLAWFVTAFPLAIWLVAAIAGRWFVRRAIAPVGAMAAEAKAMTGDAIQERLPTPSRQDELGELAGAFNALLDRRQRSFEEQRRFTGDAAHQLRTPLTVLAGQIEVALRRERGPEEYRQTLGVLHEEVDELTKIVESLLFLARADGDAALPDREAVPLDRWLPEYFERWAEHPRRGDMILDVRTPTTVVTSKALLAQLLDNLVSNACKYSAAGTPIRIVADVEARGAIIAVADRGAGIASEDQAAIFEPFVRTAEARQRGVAGTGLGLAIAARIARALGGDVSVSSISGQGSSFTLTLPHLAQPLAAGARGEPRG